jgi:ribosomal protein S18 acetylase RimI-like enzyme
MLLFTHDKSRLARHFQKDPVLFAYHLGDLNDDYFSNCQWAAENASWSAIAEAVLIYNGGPVPTVMAFGLTKRFETLLDELLDLLPPKFYGHYFLKYRQIFERQFIEEPIETNLKMHLNKEIAATAAPPIGNHVRFTPADADRLLAFYSIAYPDGYFDVNMLKLGFAHGVAVDGVIIAASGVHCVSTDYRVGVLGNIATHPDWRGKGLASYLTAFQAKELQDKGCVVCLNVAKENLPAVHCYQNLGFETKFEFEDGVFQRR